MLAAAIVYARSFDVPLVGDDGSSILQNETIRDLSALHRVLSPPEGEGFTVGGRPVLNLSLAINHAISGGRVWSYHLVNLLIHAGAALLLFGLVRRTLRREWPPAAGTAPGKGRIKNPDAFAFVVALLWCLHPLQTESVTYVIQRAESLVGCLLLLTLYAFVRATGSPGSRLWPAVSLAACLLGMAAKEVMVSAPLLVLLYDRAFVSGSFAAAWKRRPGYYGGLMATWILLFALVAGAHGRGGSAGFGTTISVWHYLLTQCEAIPHYLRLVFWPHPLVFDYGTAVVAKAGAVFPQIVLLLTLLAVTLHGLKKNTPVGFLGACFFMILAPSSSVVPVATQTMAEHRMYLPLAVVIILMVAQLHACLGFRAVVGCGLVAGGFALAAFARNTVYRDPIALYTDTVQHRPENARAYWLRGNALLERNRPVEAVHDFQKAIQLLPDFVEAYHDLGSALVRAGHPAEALSSYEQALKFHPVAKTHYAYASVLAQLGRLDEAFKNYTQALQLQPDFAEAYNNRGNLLLQAGQPARAVADYEQALRTSPNYPEAHLNLAAALLSLGRKPEALLHCQAAVRLKPEWAIARWKLADALAELNRWPEAIAEYREAVRLDPNLAEACHRLGRALAQTGQVGESVAYFERALRLQPGWADVHFDFALVLEKLGRLKEAAEQDEIALRLQPALPNAAAHLARIREQGR